MATKPTFVAFAQSSSWDDASSPNTCDIAVTAGDTLYAFAITANQADALTITGGSLTWTEQKESLAASNCSVLCATAVASSTTTVTVSIAATGAYTRLGVMCFAFRATDGIGASVQGTGTASGPSVSLTTTAANSAIIGIAGDWDAGTGARTWRTINSITPTAGNGLEKAYANVSGQYTIYGAYWDDVGAAAAKTVGLSAPNMSWNAIAIEVKGTAGAASAWGPLIGLKNNRLVQASGGF